MNLNGKTLWQVGAGDTDRSYGHICIGFDVMIAGPGEPGVFEESKYRHLGDIRNSLRRFCKDARRGDIVLLRMGTGDVLAVGEVADDSAVWLEAFADVLNRICSTSDESDGLQTPRIGSLHEHSVARSEPLRE